MSLKKIDMFLTIAKSFYPCNHEVAKGLVQTICGKISFIVTNWGG